MSDDTATSELRNRKLNKETEAEFKDETVEEKIPSKWQRYKDNVRVWYHYPNELLNSVLGNTTLLRYTTFFIFGLAASSFLTLWLSDASFTITSWIYFKLFGFVYFGAFYGLWIQADGLVGENGIAPIAQTLNDLDQYLQLTSSDKVPFMFRRRGPSTPDAEPTAPSKLAIAWKTISSPLQKYFPSQYAYATDMASKLAQFPTLFWFSTSQKMLHGLFYAGMTASALLVLGVGPAPLLLLTMYACYLSFMHVFDEFLALQWDVLLLESGFASFVLSLSSHGLNMFHILPSQVSEPSKLPIFIVWWLVFRLMFASGVVKLTSRDKTWANLTAMSYHYRTQPLPTPSSLYMHNLPLWLHKVETLGTFVIELVFPLLMFGPSWMRAFAALSFTFLNATISLTGNYGFFNVLTIVLSVLLVEDKYWTLDIFAPTSWQLPSIGLSAIVEIPAFALVAAASIAIMNRAWRCTVMVPPKSLSSIVKKVSSFYLVSSYGLFAVMTTKRIELIIEGSQDGTNWIPYEFKYKPGDLRRAPPFIPGHMPRLDWRMWFCAFHKYPNIPNWFTKLLKDLAAGKPDVMNLLEKCPFDAKNPPQCMRVQRYDYTFSTAQELKETGQWWQRSEREPLFRGMLRFPTPAS